MKITKLTMRIARGAEELERFKVEEEMHHELGKTHSGGDTMRLVFENERGDWVALMVWGSACYRLKPRDEFIGWSPSMRAKRQKLVINNRRFTILLPKEARRNIASQCLGLARKQLPDLWHEEFGYRPLIAETFCDISNHEGTCYKAAGWHQLGLTQGFKRVNRKECDFFVEGEGPKTIWVDLFYNNAIEVINAQTLPASCQAGANCDADGVLPIKKRQAESLLEAMCDVRDPRDDNKSIPSASILTLLTMATMSGANSVKAVWRYGESLTMQQRKALCFPRMKGKKGEELASYYKIPRYETIYNFLRKLDVDDYARVLSEWLASQDGNLPRQLSIDGKFVKDVVGIVSLVNVETKAPVAVALASQKEGEGDKCEQVVVRKLLAENNLENALVGSDALNCQQSTCRSILDHEGEYLVQIKDNQKGLKKNAKNIIKAKFAVDHEKKNEKNRNRIEERETWIYPLDDSVQLGMVGAHTLIVTKRHIAFLGRPFKSGKHKGQYRVLKESDETVLHASSICIDKIHDAKWFGSAIRNYWGIETGYHSRRDGTYCEDMRTRRGNRNVISAMLLARTVAMYFYAKSGMDNAQAFRETIARTPRKALRFVTSHKPL